MSDAVGIHSPDFVSEVNHVESAFQKGRPQDGVNLQGTANDLSRQVALVHVPALVPQQRFSNRKRAYRIMMMADDSTKRTGGTGGGSEHVAGRLGTIEFTSREGSPSPDHPRRSISQVDSHGPTSERLTQQRRPFGADVFTPLS